MSLDHFFRPIRARPRLLIALLLGLLLWLVMPRAWPSATRMILALDGGGLFFLAATWLMMNRATPERMRLRASMQDEGRATILILTLGAAIFSLTAIALELRGLKDLPGGTAWIHLSLAGLSLITSWLVIHTLFALHYAHSYYGDRDGNPLTIDHRGGLIFPECPQPDYWDFMYFALVVGMTGQTSDVQISDRRIRRLCLAQGVLAFFFNTVILALTINIAAGLL